MELPEPLLKVFAVHVGLAKDPGLGISNPEKVLAIVGARLVGPAFKRVTVHPQRVLTETDITILRQLIPFAPGISAVSYAVLEQKVKAGKFKHLKDLTEDNLLEKIAAIFEHKLPELLKRPAK
jgi:hypothetical protein